jgi:GT2 family glycosyltransferase
MSAALVPASCCVVCYKNRPDQIERLLASVDGCWPLLMLYVVDNSPTEQVRAVAQRFGARYRHQPGNPGFSRSHNWALRQAVGAGSKYHFVLNPDIHFPRNVIGIMLRYMEQYPDIGLLAPRVNYPDGRLQHLCKLLPTPVDLAVRRFLPWLHRCSGRQARYELHGSGYNKVMEVPALSGCFMLVRVETLLRVGLFDERFFLYFEDIDLSRRIGRVARTVFVPCVSVVHDYAKGSYKNWRLLWHHSVSAIRYFNKWGWLRDTERKRVNARALGMLAPSRNISTGNSGSPAGTDPL